MERFLLKSRIWQGRTVATAMADRFFFVVDKQKYDNYNSGRTKGVDLSMPKEKNLASKNRIINQTNKNVEVFDVSIQEEPVKAENVEVVSKKMPSRLAYEEYLKKPKPLNEVEKDDGEPLIEPIEVIEQTKNELVLEKKLKSKRAEDLEIYKMIIDYASKGKIDELSARIGVSNKTLSYWKKKYPAVLRAFQFGEKQLHGEIVLSMAQLALGGQTVRKQVVVNCREEYGQGRERKVIYTPKIVEVEEELAPNFNAQKYVLENKEAEVWTAKDKEIRLTMETKNVVDNMSAEEAQALVELLQEMESDKKITHQQLKLEKN